MNTKTMFLIGGCSGSFVAPTENRLIFDEMSPDGIRRELFCREKYGSRTSSYFLRHRDTFIIIDQGLGVEPISEFVSDMLRVDGLSHPTVYCLQTHYHEDHISGIHANNLLFQPHLALKFFSPMLSGLSDTSGSMMERILEDSFNKDKWPVTLEQLDEAGASRSHSSFAPGDTLQLGDVQVSTIGLYHPGGCCGFRFDLPGSGSIVLLTDCETGDQPDQAIVEFMDDASLLLSDMQYRNEEFDGAEAIGRLATSRKDWGHGYPRSVLACLAATTRVPRQVRIIHHEPKRSDSDLDLFCRETIAMMNHSGVSQSCDFDFARDGDVYWLPQ